MSAPAARAGELLSQLTGLTVRRSQVGAASPTKAAAGVISARRAGSVPPAFGLRRQGRSKRPMGVSPGPQFELGWPLCYFALKPEMPLLHESLRVGCGPVQHRRKPALNPHRVN